MEEQGQNLAKPFLMKCNKIVDLLTRNQGIFEVMIIKRIWY